MHWEWGPRLPRCLAYTECQHGRELRPTRAARLAKAGTHTAPVPGEELQNTAYPRGNASRRNPDQQPPASPLPGCCSAKEHAGTCHEFLALSTEALRTELENAESANPSEGNTRHRGADGAPVPQDLDVLAGMGTGQAGQTPGLRPACPIPIPASPRRSTQLPREWTQRALQKAGRIYSGQRSLAQH